MFVMFIRLGENRSLLFAEGMSLNQLLHDVNFLRMITTFRTMVGVFLNSGKKPECVIPCFQAECYDGLFLSFQIGSIFPSARNRNCIEP